MARTDVEMRRGRRSVEELQMEAGPNLFLFYQILLVEYRRAGARVGALTELICCSPCGILCLHQRPLTIRCVIDSDCHIDNDHNNDYSCVDANIFLLNPSAKNGRQRTPIQRVTVNPCF